MIVGLVLVPLLLIITGNFITIVAANSFVTESFPKYSIIGGNPAKLIRKFTAKEIDKLKEND